MTEQEQEWNAYADDLIERVMKLETVNVEYCPGGYDKYVCRHDVVDLIKNYFEN